ncbi:SUR7 family protein pun1 [Colletotrichum orbiculare MAFF 240422]|uniref:SUR7 family protein pun1 n=1 Tax=Colletotrichum orbiculare (strain 104-T / ATCC 96160 / CBS 514.97 / LARS 414 / MAFF 240422) TaxID=1213857 RepID=N4UZX9_COLOR|nr:SUR7 family protein pun1 [Colletotrichum orbiculare MAFF 240422]
MHFSTIVPLVLSIVAFVLSFLALFAGHKEGFMEEYDVIRLNMSTLGQNVFELGADPSDNDDAITVVEGLLGGITDEVQDLINDITSDIADRLANELGISEWYSLHLMDVCQGEFAPNVTAPNPWLNVTKCTQPRPGPNVNLTKMLDQELSIGPMQISLADLEWPDSLEDALDKVNKALLAIFVLYVLGIAFSGLAILGSLAAFFLGFKKLMTVTNFVFAFLAALVLFAGSLVTTIGAKEGAKQINDLGEDVRISADVGQKFMIISWVAFAVMAAAAVYWVTQFCVDRRSRRRGYTEKRHHKGSF